LRGGRAETVRLGNGPRRPNQSARPPAQEARRAPRAARGLAGRCRGPHARAPEGGPLMTSLTRREVLYGLGVTLGSVAFSSQLADESRAGDRPLSPKRLHHPARAKACIFLMMEGAPSHIDTFDPKPRLAELHLKEFTRNDKMQSAMSGGKRYYVASPFRFARVGHGGADMAVNWEHLAAVADELCFYRACQVDSVNHPTALYQMNTANRPRRDPPVP